MRERFSFPLNCYLCSSGGVRPPSLAGTTRARLYSLDAPCPGARFVLNVSTVAAKLRRARKTVWWYQLPALLGAA